MKHINTVSTDDILCIISRIEFLHIHDTLDKENLVLISISEPVKGKYKDSTIPDDIVTGFKNFLRVKFWDVTKDTEEFPIIDDITAKQIQEFILTNKDEKFVIHCRAGKSRSAGVGKAIECIKHFGIGDDAVYYYKTSFSSEIDNNTRYAPNLTVFDKIVKDYNEVL